MTGARAGLAISLAAFAAWVGWLGYLVATEANVTVLRRPHLLAADAHALVDLDGGSGKVVQVLKSGTFKVAAGQPIELDNFADCRGYRGPGTYLVPLAAGAAGKFRVPDPLPSAGFIPVGKAGKNPAAGPHVFPWTAEVRRQYEDYQRGG